MTNTTILPVLLILAILCGACAHRNQAVSAGAAGQICMPPTWYGITTGKTSDTQALSLHGFSPFKADDADGRGRRYYRDNTGSLLMVLHVGLDGIVNGMTVGVQQASAQYDSTSIPVSTKLRSRKGISDSDLQLGSTKEDVRNLLGTSKEEDVDSFIWTYEIYCVDSAPGHRVDLVFMFEGDRLVSASLSERSVPSAPVTLGPSR